MNRNKNAEKKRSYSNKGRRQDKDGRPSKDKYNGDEAKLNAEGRPNNPNYYFLDKNVADQVSQLSFQTIGGNPFWFEGTNVNYPNIKTHYWNPSAGVSIQGTVLNQSGINMAGLRIFTKLSAFTGRTAVYGPQDISIMILAMGEIISVMEWIRRVFGIAFLGSETNRTYPRALMRAMKVDDNDFYPRYAEYRNRFNKLVTLINQIPIPQNIAYFDKCAHMFEKVYLDAASPLATAIIDNIATTWMLDETSFSGGSILKTCTFTVDATTGQPVSGVQGLHYYLDWAEFLINALLNSSTLQIVYTDLLNLATKIQTKFWKFDYLIDGYMVVPEYNPGYLLQMHNARIIGTPTKPTLDQSLFYTPNNDVYPDAGNNNLIYNPGFLCPTLASNPRTGTRGRYLLIDMLTPNPTVEDRIEVLRWTALGSGVSVQDTGDNNQYEVNMILPDHYIVCAEYWVAGSVVVRTLSSASYASTSPLRPVGTEAQLVSVSTKVDWDSLYFNIAAPSGQTTILYSGNIIGDLNYFTRVDDTWLKPIFEFTALALYEMRM